MRTNFTDLTIILDRSGSMSSIRQPTIDGFNKFLAEQKTVPGEACWSLVQFDDQYESGNNPDGHTYSAKSQDAVPPLTTDTYCPRGNTALIDAIGRTIDETGQRLAALPEHERPEHVCIVIITDGLENASHEYVSKGKFDPNGIVQPLNPFSRVSDMITHQREKYNWKFLYLGANQDAIAEAAKYGIPRATAMSYSPSPTGTSNTFAVASAGITRVKSVGEYEWSDGDRAAAMQDK